MVCASCDRELPGSAVICVECNAPEPRAPSKGDAEPSYRDLAQTVRYLKGLVFLSIMFGIFVAPFAVYFAGRALRTFGPQVTRDPILLRKLVALRRIATALLIVWAAILGAWLGQLTRG